MLAQHYGISTSLLDWATNPLTSLYFASQTNDKLNGRIISLTSDYFFEYQDLFFVDVFSVITKKPVLVDS